MAEQHRVPSEAAVPAAYRQARFTLDGGRVRCDCGRTIAPQDMVVEQLIRDGDGCIVAVECLACGVKGHLTVDPDTVDDIIASFPMAARTRRAAEPT